MRSHHEARERHTTIARGGGDELELQRPLQHRALFEREIAAVRGEGGIEHGEGMARELKDEIERIAETGRVFLQVRSETLYAHARRQVVKSRPFGAIPAVDEHETLIR